ncbi:MAG: DUF6152 family protein [Pseudomonadota bacterium]
MQRRTLLQNTAALPLLALPLWVQAHHGWSSFDQDRPIWIDGVASKVLWQNPHATLLLDRPANPVLPADLAQRAVPAQSAPVDGKALLAKAVLPQRKDPRWEVELAPLTRLAAWKVAEIKPGAPVGILGFTFPAEKGEAVVRVEYLFVDGKVYGLRSSPA